MKLCLVIVALFCIAQFASAEEKPAPFITALSSTTVRGYIYATGHWQQHVCRPARPLRAERVVSTNGGTPRIVGRNVRCRHGFVYVPNSARTSVFPTPNRSSRFVLRRATPIIDHQTQTVLMEAHRIRWAPRPDRSLPPLPPTPLNPTNRPPLPPVIVMPPRDATLSP